MESSRVKLFRKLISQTEELQKSVNYFLETVTPITVETSTNKDYVVITVWYKAEVGGW